MSQTFGQNSALPHRMLIQMSGAPGSGKSTMAKLLQKSIGGLVIDHDVIRSSLLEDSDIPFDQIAKKAYHLQWAFAKEVVQQGLNVIIDSTCNFQEVLDQGSALAEQYGFIYWYVECKVEDIDLLDKRLRTRISLKSQRTGVENPPEAARSARKGEDSRAQFKKWIEAPCRSERNAIIVDSASDLERGRDCILKLIVPRVDVETCHGWWVIFLLGYPWSFQLIFQQNMVRWAATEDEMYERLDWR